MRAGSRFSAPSAVAGSPGSARTPTNTSMLERSRTMRAAPTLRRRKPLIYIASLWTRAAPTLRKRKPPIVLETFLGALLEPRELRADEAVAEDVHSADGLRDAEPVDGVVEVDQRQVLRHLDEGRVVEGDPPVELQHCACLVRRLVDTG